MTFTKLVALPALLALAAGALLAGPPAAAAGSTAGCTAATSYVRAEVVDRAGRPNGAYVDSRCPGRTLRVNLASRFHFLRHVGRTAPGSTITVFYVDAGSQAELHHDAPAVGRSGVFRTGLTDVSGFASAGQALQVVVHHEDPGPSAQQDLIEYALLAAFIS
jgi:hypothetical protein